MQVVALWISSKPNKEFDMPMTGSQEVYSGMKALQFFIILIRRKYLRIQVSVAQV